MLAIARRRAASVGANITFVIANVPVYDAWHEKQHHCSWARMAFASLTSRVSNPSVKRL
jgi:hypothetical protein